MYYVVADGRRLPLPRSGFGRGVLGSRGTVVTAPGQGGTRGTLSCIELIAVRGARSSRSCERAASDSQSARFDVLVIGVRTTKVLIRRPISDISLILVSIFQHLNSLSDGFSILTDESGESHTRHEESHTLHTHAPHRVRLALSMLRQVLSGNVVVENV